MPTATKPLKELPQPQIQFIDPKTGLPTKEFYEFLKALEALVRALRLEIP